MVSRSGFPLLLYIVYPSVLSAEPCDDIWIGSSVKNLHISIITVTPDNISHSSDG